MVRKNETAPDDKSANRHDNHISIHYTIDPDESISHNVIRAVAAATEVSPERLEPLYNV
ncbi:MAG: HalOD1 output domain-containing protein, partial [Euryarchaeota archaeon]|nr:HalOD1 output domain-containing protein [Euryarchaeota archaeon]